MDEEALKRRGPRDSGGWSTWTAPDLRVELRVRSDVRDSQRRITEVRVAGDNVIGEDLRQVASYLRRILAMERRRTIVRKRLPAQTKPLGRPQGDNDQGFYVRLAERYTDVAEISPAPNAVIAHEEGVPVSTVRRWVVTARRKGLLPEGRKGAAG